MQKHKFVQHKIGSFEKCKLCPGFFKNIRSLLDHLKIEHKGEGIHSCKSCDAIFTSKTGLTKHLTSSHKKKQRKLSFTCDICKMNFQEKEELIEHKSSVHGFDVFEPSKNLAIFVSNTDGNYGNQDDEDDVEIIKCELQGDLIVFTNRLFTHSLVWNEFYGKNQHFSVKSTFTENIYGGCD